MSALRMSRLDELIIVGTQARRHRAIGLPGTVCTHVTNDACGDLSKTLRHHAADTPESQANGRR